MVALQPGAKQQKCVSNVLKEIESSTRVVGVDAHARRVDESWPGEISDPELN